MKETEPFYKNFTNKQICCIIIIFIVFIHVIIVVIYSIVSKDIYKDIGPDGKCSIPEIVYEKREDGHPYFYIKVQIEDTILNDNKVDRVRYLNGYDIFRNKTEITRDLHTEEVIKFRDKVKSFNYEMEIGEICGKDGYYCKRNSYCSNYKCEKCPPTIRCTDTILKKYHFFVCQYDLYSENIQIGIEKSEYKMWLVKPGK